MYEILDWDSGCFEFKVARINPCKLTEPKLRTVLSQLELEQVELAYLTIDRGDPLTHLARRYGALLVDTKVTYIAELRGTDSASLERLPQIRILKGEPTKEIEDLAIQSGHMSRFAVDPFFPQEKLCLLYREWIRKSLDGSLAEQVLIWSDSENEAGGLITMNISNNIGRIGLVAVGHELRGKGIGFMLVRAAKSYFLTRNITQVKVVTQSRNIAACALYKKSGFVESKLEAVFHFWFQQRRD